MNNQKLKTQLLSEVLKAVNEKCDEAAKAIQLVKESRDNESKSSVGDKYETGRSMLMLEWEKHEMQLQKAQLQKHELLKINLLKKFNRAEFGSLVITNQGIYFLAVALGKIEIDGESCFCISPVSPFGKLIAGKIAGDKIKFQGKEIVILDVV